MEDGELRVDDGGLMIEEKKLANLRRPECYGLLVAQWCAGVGLVFLLLPGIAAAQLHFEGFLGTVKNLSRDVEIRQPGLGTNLVFHDVEFTGESLKEPLYAGVRAGVFLSKPRWLGFEVELIHNKAYGRTERNVRITGNYRGAPYHVTTPMKTVVRDLSFSHGANMLFANGAARKDWLGVNWRARLGLGIGITHAESTIDGEHVEQYETTFPAAQISLGMGTRLWRFLEFIAEYKFTLNTVNEVTVAHGHASTEILTHHLVAGMGLVF